MRHFRSILYALVLAPAVWVLVAVGLTHDLTARGRDGFAVESLTGLVLLLLGGAAYGILVFAPISPLGPVVAGVVFLVVGVWAIEWPSGYAGRWPSGVVKDGFDLSRPGYGLAALLAVPLIMTVLSVRRWAGFEPVVLPIIGPVGRARGAAAVAGTPVAVMQTAVLEAPPAGAFLANAFDERTTLIRMPGADAAPEATTVLTRPAEDDGEATTVLRAPAVADESAGPEEPTDAIADERPTGDVLSEPPTEDVLEEPPTEDVAAGIDEPTDVIADEQPTEDVAGPPAVSLTDDEATEPGPAVVDEPETVAAEASDEATEPIDAADEEKTAVVVPPTDEATVLVPVAESAEPIEAAGGEAGDGAEADDEPAEAEAARADEGAAVEAAEPQAISATEPGEVAAPEVADVVDEEVGTEAAAEVQSAGIAEPDEDSGPTEAADGTDEAATTDLATAENDQPADDEPVTSVLALNEEQQPADEEVADVEPATDNEPAAVEEPAADDEPAVESGAVVDDEPATSVLTLAESDAPASEEGLGDEPTLAVSTATDDEHAAEDETSDASSSAPVDSDESADDQVSANAVVADDVVDVVEGDEDVEMVEETTYLLMPADDDGRTQALRLAAELEKDGERTQVIRPVGYEPGQTTRDLGAPGDRTQVIWPSAHRVPGEKTQVIGSPGEKTRRIVRSGEKVAGLDETQLIRLPDPTDDGGRTQVIRAGQVTPPGEHLQPHPVTPPGDDAELTLAVPAETTPPAGVGPVRLPRQRVDSDPLPDDFEEPAEPDAPPSIARAESPNFAEDPTGRIVWPVLPADEEPTRTMTVMNIERPPDEAPEIPTQRQPSADE